MGSRRVRRGSRVMAHTPRSLARAEPEHPSYGGTPKECSLWAKRETGQHTEAKWPRAPRREGALWRCAQGAGTHRMAVAAPLRALADSRKSGRLAEVDRPHPGGVEKKVPG